MHVSGDAWAPLNGNGSVQTFALLLDQDDPQVRLYFGFLIQAGVTPSGTYPINRTDKSGHVTINLHPKKPGIVLVKPASYKGCANPRIGVIGAFTPPVTG